MIMNSHDRRIALRLTDLAPDAPVCVWGRSPDSVAGGRANGYPCRFVRVDHDEWSLHLKSQREPDLPSAIVPLVFVQAVWRVENAWNIAIDGDVFLLDSS